MESRPLFHFVSCSDVVVFHLYIILFLQKIKNVEEISESMVVKLTSKKASASDLHRLDDNLNARLHKLEKKILRLEQNSEQREEKVIYHIVRRTSVFFFFFFFFKIGPILSAQVLELEQGIEEMRGRIDEISLQLTNFADKEEIQLYKDAFVNNSRKAKETDEILSELQALLASKADLAALPALDDIAR